MTAVLCLAVAIVLPLADADESVNAGGTALGKGYPWYDKAEDRVRRIDVEPPPPPPPPRPQPSFTLPELNLMWLAWLALALLLGALVYLLIRAYRQRQRSPKKDRAEGEETADEGSRIDSLPLPARSGRLDLLDLARQCLQQGDYSRAILYLFSFQLLWLDKHQVIRLAKGKTNRQYLREIGPRAALRRLVEQTMVAFEDVFFGRHTLDRTRFESCWSRLEEFQAMAQAATG